MKNQAGPLAGENPAEKSSNVKQRSAAADQTYIVWAVADNIAICAQNSILQRDCVHNPSRLPKTHQLRTIHHRTSLQSLTTLSNCTCFLLDVSIGGEVHVTASVSAGPGALTGISMQRELVTDVCNSPSRRLALLGEILASILRRNLERRKRVCKITRPSFSPAAIPPCA